jgi:hypothetical protein
MRGAGKPFKRKTLAEALTDHLEPDLNGGCLLWAGSTESHGYGVLDRDGHRVLAHRAAFEIWTRPLRRTDRVSQLCGVRQCCNPAHLALNAAPKPRAVSAGGRPKNGVSAEDRLVEGIRIDPRTQCWLWTGSRNAQGYGNISHEGRHLVAHRLAWLLWRGPIDVDIKVLHRCDTPPCCNPDHLFLGTQADNVADMVAKGRHRPGS